MPEFLSAFIPIAIFGIIVGIFFAFIIRGFRKGGSPTKSISKLFKIFAHISFFIAALLLLSLASSFSLLGILSFLSVILNATIFLYLSRAIFEEKRWAWFISLAIMIWGFITGTFHLLTSSRTPFYSGDFLSRLLSVIFSVLLICLLIKAKETFLRKPKQVVSQYIKDKNFLIVALGITLIFIIGTIVLIL